MDDQLAVLLGNLDDADAHVRWYSAWQIGKMGAEARSALPKLEELISDASRAVRIEAAAAIRAIDPEFAACLPSLTETVDEHDDDGIRDSARLVLQRLGQLAVQLQFITVEQLKDCIVLQSSGANKRLGELLVDKGYLTREQLIFLMKRQLELREKHERGEGEPGRRTGPLGLS